MKPSVAILLVISTCSAFTYAYSDLERRDAYANTYSEADAFNQYSPLKPPSDALFPITARDVDPLIRDAYFAGHDDASREPTLPRFPPTNHPTFEAGSFENLPSSQPPQVAHHGPSSPLPPKSAEEGDSYFPQPGAKWSVPEMPDRSKSPQPEPVAKWSLPQVSNRRGSFKRRELENDSWDQ